MEERVTTSVHDAIHIFKKNTDAPGTNRGFLFQYLVTVEDWFDIFARNSESVIYVETDDDIKELSALGNNVRFSQVKCYSPSFNLNSSEIKQSVLHFFLLFLEHGQDQDVEFRFLTNTSISPTESLLPDWIASQENLDAVLLERCRIYLEESLKGAIQNEQKKKIQKPKRDQSAISKAAENLLTQVERPELLNTFCRSIKWEFGSIDPLVSIEARKQNILSRLQGNSELLFARLLSEVIFKAGQIERSLSASLMQNIFKESVVEMQRQIAPNLRDELLALRIDFAEKHINEFRPTSAIRELEVLALDDASQGNNKRLARINHLMGNAHDLNEKVQLSRLCHEKALNYDPDNEDYRCSLAALLIHGTSEEIQKGLAMVEPVLSENPKNQLAWIIWSVGRRAQNHHDTARIPEEIADSWKYHTYLAQEEWMESCTITEIVNAYSVLGKYSDPANLPEIVTMPDYRSWLITYQVVLFHAYSFQSTNGLVRKPEPVDRRILENAAKILEKLTSRLEGTEIRHTAVKFQSAKLKYILAEKNPKVYVFQMFSIFQELSKRKPFLQDLLLALAQQGQHVEAIEILKNEDWELTPEQLGLCYRIAQMGRDFELAERFLETYVSSVGEMDDLQFNNHIVIIESLSGTRSEMVHRIEDLNSNKYFTEHQVSVGTLYLKSSANPVAHKIAKEALAYLEKARNLSRPLQLLLAIVLHRVGHIKESTTILEEYADLDHIDLPLELLISNLARIGERRDELLRLLEGWRKRVGLTNPEFVSIELRLLRRLGDWVSIGELAKAALRLYPNDSTCIECHVTSLWYQQKLEELSQFLRKISPNAIAEHTSLMVSSLCLALGEFQIALDLVYPHALDPNHNDARMQYCFEIFPKLPENFFPVPTQPEVVMDTWVKLSRRDRSFLKQIDSVTIQQNGIARYLLEIGAESGESYPDAPGGTVKVEAIIQKHLGLYLEIMGSLDSVDSEFRVKMFTIDDQNENIWETIHAKMIEVLGAESELQAQEKETYRKSYQEGSATVTEIATVLWNKNMFRCNQWLWHKLGPGYRIRPKSNYESETIGAIQFPNPERFHFSHDKDYILDLSTVFLMADLDSRLGLKWPRKFIVSPYLRCSLIDSLMDAKNDQGTSIEVRAGYARPVLTAKEELVNRVHLIESTLAWINKQCVEKLTIDALRINRDIESQGNELYRYNADNTFLALAIDSRVITDDNFYTSNGWLNIQISSEHFLWSAFPDRFKSEILPELLRKGYQGLTLDAETIYSVFNASAIDDNQSFQNVLRNFSPMVHPTNWLESSVDFLYKLTVEGVLPNQNILNTAGAIFFTIANRIENKETRSKAYQALSFKIRMTFYLRPIEGNVFIRVLDKYFII